MDIPYKYVRTREEIRLALESLIGQPLISVDTETTGLDPHTEKVLLLQLGSETMSYVIDLTADNPLATNDKNSTEWKILKDLLEGSATKVGHNIAFDIKMIRSHFDIQLANVFDTMIAERVLTAGKSFREGGGKKFASLADVTAKYTDLTAQDMKKEIRAGFYSGYVLTDFSQDQIEYSARDIAVLIPIYWAQLTQLMDEDLIPTASLEFQVVPVTASMEYMGVNFDTDKWVLAMQELDEDRLIKRREIEAVFKQRGLQKQGSLFEEFCTISIDSPSQLLQALKQLGVPLGDSTSSSILEKFSGDYPILQTILKYRENQKLITAFGDSLLNKINAKTGKLHGSFMQIGADTGRFSARDPNLQQIPSDTKCTLRDCFVAPPGFVALGADYSQQELRVLAAISGEQNMLDAYQQGEDLHTMTTAFLFNRDINELKALLKSRDDKIDQQRSDAITEEEKEAKRQRGIAKSINFLIAYSGSYKRLAQTARVTEEFAQEVMSNHGSTFPKLKYFIETKGAETLQKMYSTTVLGRKRFYSLPDPSDPDYDRIKASIRRQGVNHIIQGTSADITKRALVYTHNRFTEKFGQEHAYIWGVIHDEIQCMVKENIVEEAKLVLEECMERAYYDFIPKEICPIKIDAQYSSHWVH